MHFTKGIVSSKFTYINWNFTNFILPQAQFCNQLKINKQ